MELGYEELDTNDGQLDVPLVFLELRHYRTSRVTEELFCTYFDEIKAKVRRIYRETVWMDGLRRPSGTL
jgi:hypothetical protein